MKKPILVSLLAVLSVLLTSWGNVGHQTVGKIAEAHLSKKAKAAVQDLLGDKSLADVASWADDVRNQDEFKETAPWHFLNLPLGLDRQTFDTQVQSLAEQNVFSALTQLEKELTDPATPREKKIAALKFIVHFVGDLHQPMHISRKEDKGGNTIQLNYEGKGTNLHSLWDSKLIATQGLNYEQFASKLERVRPAKIKKWQRDPMMQWLWESYQISSQLYAEVDAMKGRSIGKEYYEQHIPVINERIQQAGIRLAGVLNDTFK
ncbi:S1/P1 nuclease [Chitinophaga dinghuensis]|uniref:S1/P1 nuclease n=1 Tax=Chitinophaga dinghuensis TaxID=1539050 RepID=A0A327VSV7_9BACT|nr:S1/P1 nuclease [Chitinophaga dinghuensis]RAJ78989.1 S1/P1 nuclease [Chitinophaga dinghuensis]